MPLMMLFPTASALPALFQEWRENFGQRLPAADSILVNCPLAGCILFGELGTQTGTPTGNFLPNPTACCGSDKGNPEQWGTRPQGKAALCTVSTWLQMPCSTRASGCQEDNYTRTERELKASRAQHGAVYPFPGELLEKRALLRMTQMRK